MSVSCGCVKYHQPAGFVANVHHILPLSWGGLDVPANKITICPNTHTAVHREIDRLVRARGVSTTGISRYVLALARDAYDRRPSDTPPVTSLPEVIH